MDNGNGLHTYNGILLNCREMKFIEKISIRFGKILLSEVAQTDEDKYCMCFSKC